MPLFLLVCVVYLCTLNVGMRCTKRAHMNYRQMKQLSPWFTLFEWNSPGRAAIHEYYGIEKKRLISNLTYSGILFFASVIMACLMFYYPFDV